MVGEKKAKKELYHNIGDRFLFWFEEGWGQNEKVFCTLSDDRRKIRYDT